MNKSAWLLFLIVGGYIAFELFTLHTLGYRTEVNYILKQMVPAQHAMDRCGVATTEKQRETYNRHLNLLAIRAEREFLEARPELRENDAAQQFKDKVNEIKQSVDATIEAQGCDDPEVTLLMKRYKIYAGRK